MRACNTHAEEKLKQQNKLYNDSLVVVKKKNGDLYYQNQNLVIARSNDFKALEAMTKEQAKLQEIISKKTTSASAVSTTLNVSGSQKTIILPGDTIYIDNAIEVFPTYSINICTPLREGFITASKDSVKYQITEHIDFTIEQKKSGFFKKKDVIEFHSNNPNVVVTGLSGVTIYKKPRRFCIGPYIGYGISTSGNFSTQIGFGITYRVF